MAAPKLRTASSSQNRRQQGLLWGGGWAVDRVPRGREDARERGASQELRGGEQARLRRVQELADLRVHGGGCGRRGARTCRRDGDRKSGRDGRESSQGLSVRQHLSRPSFVPDGRGRPSIV